MSDEEQSAPFRDDITRRDALSAIVRAAAAALPLGLSSQVSALQAPAAPVNVRLSEGPPKQVLRPEDFRLLGFYRFAGVSDMDMMAGTAFPCTAFRKVGNEVRLFVIGGPRTNFTDYILWEVTLPSSDPSLTPNSAPRVGIHRIWGNITRGFADADGTGGIFPGALLYDAARNAIWWTYSATYVASYKFPPLGCTLLNETAGTFRTYGPWRTQLHPNMVLGGLGYIPAAFASQHTGGKRLGMMGAQVSGNAYSPYGASLAAHDFPDPTTTPPDFYSDDQAHTMSSQTIIQHPMAHPQRRDQRYKICRYVRNGAQPYTCTPNGTFGGATAELGPPVFGMAGTGDSGAGNTDSISSWAWIETATKHGLLFLGQLATTPTGYRAAGDAEGLIHRGYARLDGDPPVCCHGQDDPFFTSTGPWAHASIPMAWIYNPDHLVPLAKGTADPWSLTPTSEFQWITRAPQFTSPLDRLSIGRFPQGAFSPGAHYDPDTRRLYTVLRFMENSDSHARPVVCVWEVS